MSRRAAAIDVRWPQPPAEDDIGRVLARLDDCGPSAVDETAAGIRIFFLRASDRDAGLARLEDFGADIAVQPVDVPDEEWAERSQATLTAVRVGDLAIAPPWAPPIAAPHRIVILPSMGFGTGHHASTRLCLALLQRVALRGASMLDVGTGSGVLALAAWTLGAARILALDVDPDAVQSARDNLALNGAADAIELRAEDALSDRSPHAGTFDVVTANLTAAMIERHADRLAAMVESGGRLIASGFQPEDEAAVTGALELAGLAVMIRLYEDGWAGLLAARPPVPDF